jgi:hypothetical protein
MEENLDINVPSRKKYKGNKLIDFIVGLGVGLSFIIWGIYHSGTLSNFMVIVFIISYILAILCLFMAKRKFIALGIILSVILCLIFIMILIGTCNMRF